MPMIASLRRRDLLSLGPVRRAGQQKRGIERRPGEIGQRHADLVDDRERARLFEIPGREAQSSRRYAVRSAFQPFSPASRDTDFFSSGAVLRLGERRLERVPQRRQLLGVTHEERGHALRGTEHPQQALRIRFVLQDVANGIRGRLAQRAQKAQRLIRIGRRGEQRDRSAAGTDAERRRWRRPRSAKPMRARSVRVVVVRVMLSGPGAAPLR